MHKMKATSSHALPSSHGSLSLLFCGNSLAAQWLGLHAFTAEGAGSIPGWGTKILQAVQHGQSPPKNNSKKNPLLF